MFCFQNGRLKGYLDIQVERSTSLKHIRKDKHNNLHFINTQESFQKVLYLYYIVWEDGRDTG